MAGWVKEEAGRWVKNVSATGRYVAQLDKSGWNLSYEGGHSRTVLSGIATLRDVKQHVDFRGWDGESQAQHEASA